MENRKRPAYYLGEKHSIVFNKYSWYYVKNDEKKALDFLLTIMFHIHTGVQNDDGGKGWRSVSINILYKYVKKIDPGIYGKIKESKFTGGVAPMSRQTLTKHILTLHYFLNVQGLSTEGTENRYSARVVSLNKEGWYYCERYLELKVLEPDGE